MLSHIKLSVAQDNTKKNRYAISELHATNTFTLDPALSEISGLAVLENYFIGLNDSGDSAKIYAFDRANLKIEKEFYLDQASNFDWEELAQDDRYLYIADIGDNYAVRRSIDIYKVAKTDIPLTALEKTVNVKSEKLNIKYGLKKNILPSSEHNFDSEAMTVVNDKIWLFSKNRKDQQTELYILDKKQQEQTVYPSASYPVNGLITAADYDKRNNRIILLGYSRKSANMGAFVWVVDVLDELPDWSSAKIYKLKPYGQWESINWLTDQTFVIAAEKSKYSKHMLAYFTLK